MNYKLFSSDHEYCPFFDAKEEEEEKDGENLRRRERKREE